MWRGERLRHAQGKQEKRREPTPSSNQAPIRHMCREKSGARLRLLLRRMIALLGLGLVLAFLFLFVGQQFLLVGVFLEQLLRLVLMLLFD